MEKEMTGHGDLTLIGKIKESLKEVDLSIVGGSFVHVFGRELVDEGGRKRKKVTYLNNLQYTDVGSAKIIIHHYRFKETHLNTLLRRFSKNARLTYEYYGDIRKYRKQLGQGDVKEFDF